MKGSDEKEKTATPGSGDPDHLHADALDRIGHELEKRYAAGEPRSDIEEYRGWRQGLIKQTRDRGR